MASRAVHVRSSRSGASCSKSCAVRKCKVGTSGSHVPAGRELPLKIRAHTQDDKGPAPALGRNVRRVPRAWPTCGPPPVHPASSPATRNQGIRHHSPTPALQLHIYNRHIYAYSLLVCSRTHTFAREQPDPPAPKCIGTCRRKSLHAHHPGLGRYTPAIGCKLHTLLLHFSSPPQKARFTCLLHVDISESASSSKKPKTRLHLLEMNALEREHLEFGPVQIVSNGGRVRRASRGESPRHSSHVPPHPAPRYSVTYDPG